MNTLTIDYVPKNPILKRCEDCKPVSRYFEKQWRNFNIGIGKNDMKEAFIEHEPSPEPEEETMYTRRSARSRARNIH